MFTIIFFLESTNEATPPIILRRWTDKETERALQLTLKIADGPLSIDMKTGFASHMVYDKDGNELGGG